MGLFARYPPMTPTDSPDRTSKASDKASDAPSKTADGRSFIDELKHAGPSPHTGDDPPAGDSVAAPEGQGPSPHAGDDSRLRPKGDPAEGKTR
jgi:hypothetical protein